MEVLCVNVLNRKQTTSAGRKLFFVSNYIYIQRMLCQLMTVALFVLNGK